MKRYLVFGNSGSGKSTLALRIKQNGNITHLDLDTIAWSEPGLREELAVSVDKLHTFINTHEEWVIEGCYGSLIEQAAQHANELVFINLGTEACQQNCRARPWEAHKYASKKEQDKNLNMLLEWVAAYETRSDEFSLAAHRKIFDDYDGNKTELKSNRESQGYPID